MKLDLERVRRNVQDATTEDLLDRATVYRAEMEIEALSVIEGELAKRGVTVEQIETHLKQRNERLTRSDGTTVKCTFCWRPAVHSGWSWHRLWNTLPVFPRRFQWCDHHLPKEYRVERTNADPDRAAAGPLSEN